MNFEKGKRIHFHTFDSLRFLSFLLVFIQHAPVPEGSILRYFSRGEVGVSFFFVLSGFLITYILILEKLNNQTIPLKKFFKRRILRIWPLYYAMVIFAFCTPYIINFFHLPFSNKGYEPNWFLTITFLENYKMMSTGMLANVSPLPVIWSLCVEEHFYIIWGCIMYFISLKNIPKLIIVCIFISFVSRIIYHILGISSLDIFTNISYFAFGAIPAYLFVFKKDIIRKLSMIPSIYKYLYFFIVILAIALLPDIIFFKHIQIGIIIFGILFSVLILFTLGDRNVFKISDRSIFGRLGKYTYGLYLIHTICLVLFDRIGKRYDLSNYTVIISALLFTIFLAYLSYHLFEKQFLKLKKSV